MNGFEIGRMVRQPMGFSAFIPAHFPPAGDMRLPKKLAAKHTEAVRLLGKIDGITHLLPDRDWFLLMFRRKDAASSSQIEGTNATIMDVIEVGNVEPRGNLPPDVDDIVHYVRALDYGFARSKELSLSSRFIKELHRELMRGARSTQHSFPGEFRTSQNWIGGTSPGTARYVPPPVEDMLRAMSDLENFIHADDDFLPLVKAGLIHAQFETVHPFTDGNGRTGRMLVTMFLWNNNLLEIPILYLSSYFKQNQQTYYDCLDGYHQGKVIEWLDFFLDGVITTAGSVIDTCARITELRQRDMEKTQKLGKTSAASTLNVLTRLYAMPLVGIADIVKWTGFTTQGGYKVIQRLVDMGVLRPLVAGEAVYAQKWLYGDYLDLFKD